MSCPAILHQPRPYIYARPRRLAITCCQCSHISTHKTTPFSLQPPTTKTVCPSCEHTHCYHSRLAQRCTTRLMHRVWRCWACEGVTRLVSTVCRRCGMERDEMSVLMAGVGESCSAVFERNGFGCQG
ncbi:hypothetical protein EX30DRAFT_112971 [Ascodesmis nigricans]|uniref:Uncharacterized protein n=1 Tax=Ascodesmis nigricans TaxID=341454 RepID=A0A4S2MQB4_9PEZI|nr:hypothetical protein EX30DRAFT_112971 [Ascodesmis nigricans]